MSPTIYAYFRFKADAAKARCRVKHWNLKESEVGTLAREFYSFGIVDGIFETVEFIKSGNARFLGSPFKVRMGA